MTAQAIAPTTEDELRQAFHAMRNRNSLRHWPADFDAAMADHLRARCIAIEAKAAARQRQRRQCAPVFIAYDLASSPDQTTHWRPTQRPSAGAIDCKRAAAGDRDD